MTIETGSFDIAQETGNITAIVTRAGHAEREA